jgi:hypothetical protein
VSTFFSITATGGGRMRVAGTDRRDTTDHGCMSVMEEFRVR